MLNGWSAAQVKGTSFEDYLNQRVAEFINNRAYPDEDRYYLTEIFALKGFLRGKKAGELMVSGLTQDTLDRWSGATGRREVRTGAPAYLSVDRVAKLDPYRRFKRPASADAEDLLADEDEGAIGEPEVPRGPSNVAALLRTIKSTVDLTQYDREGHTVYLQGLTDVAAKARTMDDYIELYKAYKEFATANSDLYSGYPIDGADQVFNSVFKGMPIRAVGDLQKLRDVVPMNEYDRNLHRAYMNKVVEVGTNSNNPAVVDKAIQLANEFRRSDSSLYSSYPVVQDWGGTLRTLQQKRLSL